MNKFREYATSTALSFSLSKAQCDLLSALSQGFSITDASHFIVTMAALERKGLAERIRKTPIRMHKGVEVIEWTLVLTSAGEVMVLLIKEAGLFVNYTRDGTYGCFGKKA